MKFSRTFFLLSLAPLLVVGQGSSQEFRKEWKIHASSSFEPSDGIPQNVIDGRPETFWHSHWSKNDVPTHPHEIAVDMGRVLSIAGFIYLPRQGRTASSVNGRIERFQYLTSTDGTNWTQVASGRFSDGSDAKTNTFKATSARFFKLVSWSGKNNGPWASVAELDVIPADEKLRTAK